MKQRPRIELPDAHADELPLRSLLAIAVACSVAGVSLGYAITDRAGGASSLEDKPAAAAPDPVLEPEPVAEPLAQPPPPLDREPETGALATVDEALAAFDTRAATPDAAVTAPEQASRAHEPPDAEVATDAPPSQRIADAPPSETALGAPPAEEAALAAATEVPTAEAEAPRARRLRVEPGFVAYLRCEGLRQRKGRYPCPRDRALELRMREIVETLPSCRLASEISRGTFDVRLELGSGGTVTDLHVRAPNEDADRAVRACAAGAFRKAETKLRPKRMIVSMRFRAR